MKRLILFTLTWTVVAVGYSQSCPPNLDLEKGDLSGWQCSVGITQSPGSVNEIILTDTTPMPGRHEIISEQSAEQLDPFGNFPTLCPYGGKYSVKLGNMATNGEAEGMSYTFTVPLDVDTLTFTYFYAVVFQDPNHYQFEQPRFFVTAYDVLTGDVINCASYNYVSTSSLPGFTRSPSSPDVLFKNWSPVSLQFAGLNGRQVRLEFKTGDCTLGGHFGYAYLDVGTACSNILATAPYCVETNSLILNAPYGFKDYTWWNQDHSQIVGTGQSITLTPPPAVMGTFFVDMVPYPGFGCRDTASATVQPLPVPPLPTADSVFACQFARLDPLFAKPLKEHDILWYTSPAGGFPLPAAPSAPTAAVDTMLYYVSQKKLFGCESFRKEVPVIIRPTPVTSFQQNLTTQCQKGNEFIFTNTSTNLSDSRSYWDFGDGTIDSSANNIIKHSYAGYGNFNIKLTVINQPVCSNEMQGSLTVVPAPVAAFNYPATICEKQTSVNLIDNSQVPQNIGVIDKWNWEVNGSKINSQQMASFIPQQPGALDIKLSVVTQEGCISDTVAKTLIVHHRPDADFEYATALCENEVIKLRDLSALSTAASGEYINSWTWDIDGKTTSLSQHTSQILPAGLHDVRLTSKTNYGCMSLPEDKSIFVHPKPHIGLHINDSCVFRKIVYTAKDISSNVQNWYWDQGNGFNKGPVSFNKAYSKEGDHPLVLIGETDQGCKDTVIREFRIYDNKSFAGNDTTVAKGQPIQLNAGGGANVTYTWIPSDGLSDPKSEKPVATLDRDQLYTMYSVTDKGCDARSDIFIKRYKGPDIYIPNAFTPDNDGKNDYLKVMPIGIKSFLFLAVYNRFGQQVFYTTDKYAGWDGKIGGRPQDSGNYVAISKAIDYNGKVMTRKENVVLLR
jgi:gliding motility-associated-like protein